VQEFLKLDRFDFASAQTALVDHEIALFQPLMQRVDPKAVAAMVDASKDSLAAAAEPVKVEKKKRKKRRKLNLKLAKLTQAPLALKTL
jgi:methionyl-tRNA synthetase